MSDVELSSAAVRSPESPTSTGGGRDRPVGPGSSPALLVSVRNGAEAALALAGGADVIDVKEPDRGSLGRPDVEAVRDVLAVRDRLSPQTPVSVALGELPDWSDADCDPRAWLPRGVQFAKVGPAGCARLDWRTLSRDLRRRADAAVEWVAVAYADAAAAQSPPVDEVAAAAVKEGCRGLLVDTFLKSTGGLLDHAPLPQLARTAQTLRRAGLFLSLAGRLRIDDLQALVGLRPEVIAIRSAACREADRDSDVETARVRRFLQALRECFGEAITASTPAAAIRPRPSGR